MNSLNKIAENFKKLRSEKGYSLEKVARLSDLSLNTIVKIENGVNENPTIDTLSNIAKALSVEINDLIK
jgi:transcriptional regulator with XRE-family HTH domain